MTKLLVHILPIYESKFALSRLPPSCMSAVSRQNLHTHTPVTLRKSQKLNEDGPLGTASIINYWVCLLFLLIALPGSRCFSTP